MIKKKKCQIVQAQQSNAVPDLKSNTTSGMHDNAAEALECETAAPKLCKARQPKLYNARPPKLYNARPPKLYNARPPSQKVTKNLHVRNLTLLRMRQQQIYIQHSAKNEGTGSNNDIFLFFTTRFLRYTQYKFESKVAKIQFFTLLLPFFQKNEIQTK